MTTLAAFSRVHDDRRQYQQAFGAGERNANLPLKDQTVQGTRHESDSRSETRWECDTQSRIQVQLQASSYLAVRRVQCRLENGVLTLLGTVPNYYSVQMAIRAVKEVLGSEAVFHNRLVVADSKPQQDSQPDIQPKFVPLLNDAALTRRPHVDSNSTSYPENEDRIGGDVSVVRKVWETTDGQTRK